jgi:hypothetical protein
MAPVDNLLAAPVNIGPVGTDLDGVRLGLPPGMVRDFEGTGLTVEGGRLVITGGAGIGATGVLAGREGLGVGLLAGTDTDGETGPEGRGDAAGEPMAPPPGAAGVLAG